MAKKLVIKRSSNKSSISAKIAAVQRQKVEPNNVVNAAKPRPLVEQKTQPNIKKFHQNTSQPRNHNILANKPGGVKQGSLVAHKKDKNVKQKSSRLREDILQEDGHKKFFLKQQVGRSSQDTSGVIHHKSTIPKEIKITEYVQVGELAKKLNVKTSDLIAKFMQLGVMVTITQSVDAETAILVAEEFGCSIRVVSLYEETLIQEEKDNEADLCTRSPIVTIMGHVDHGKTKLLDAMRSTDIVSQEAGGITQHIGAYQVSTENGSITFLDTPGHEAFTAMRARGTLLTDIVVLVVAVDDGVMPQTVEALKHAQDATVPIIVAINKIDLPDANVDKIFQSLSQHNLLTEEWGGDVPSVKISALQNLHLDKLQEVILLQADMINLRANPTKNAVGVVVEAKLDQGRGAVITVLVSNGTLKKGDPFVVGLKGGKVRAMYDSWGKPLIEAGPSTPVEILGSVGIPQAGDPFYVVDSDKKVKSIVDKREELDRQQQHQRIKRVKLENLSDAIAQDQLQELKLIVKADVLGSAEAIRDSLEKLSTDDISIKIILMGSGEITESDIMLASAAHAIIIGFSVRANARVKSIASKEKVVIYYFKIIYEIVDKIKDAMQGMIAPEDVEEFTGEAEVRQIFKVSSVGTIAGCMITSGNIQRDSLLRIVRDGVVVYEGSLKTLRRFKENVSQVKEGFECGIAVENFNDIKENDVIQGYIIQQVQKKIH